MHRWNIFLIEALSMLASPQIKTVKPPNKKASLTGCPFCVGVALNFSLFGRNCVTTLPGRAASKARWLTWFILRIPKILHVLAQDVPYGSTVMKHMFYRNDNLSRTCQCRQLKLNLLSMEINIYCLMTNQMPALLVQHALWMRAANCELLLLQSLYFSCPPSPTAIIPDACPLGTFENQDGHH